MRFTSNSQLLAMTEKLISLVVELNQMMRFN